MSKSSLLLMLLTLVVTYNVNGQDLSQCAQVTKKMGVACGGSPSSMDLTISNQCNKGIHAKFCFETIDKQWKCRNDSIFSDEKDENAYVFSECNVTGQYKLDLCQKVNGKLDCGSGTRLETPYALLTCSNGKSLEYSIKPYTKGLFRLNEKSGGTATIRVRKDKGSYYISVDDISMVLCSEPVEPSLVQSLIFSVSELVKVTKEDWIKQCSDEHHPDWCKHQYMLKMMVKDKIPGLGVRG